MRKARVILLAILLSLPSLALLVAVPSVSEAPGARAIPTYTTSGLNRDLDMNDLVAFSGGIITGSDGDYEVNGHLVIEWGYSLTLNPGDHLVIAGGCNITVKGEFRSVGTSPANRDIQLVRNASYLEPWGGVIFEHTANAAGCFVNNTLVSGAVSGFRCYVVAPTLDGNRVVGSTRSGVDCYTASPVVRNNVFENCNYGAFIDESSTPVFEKNSITGSGDGIRCYSDTVTIRDTTIANCTSNGIASYRNDATFDSVTVTGCPYGLFATSSNNTILNSTFSGNNVGVYLTYRSNLTISGSSVSDSVLSGMVVDSSTVDLTNTMMSNNLHEALEARSNLDLQRSVVNMDSCSLLHNGFKRIGMWWNYSSIYARSSDIHINDTTMNEAPYTALELYDCTAKLMNSRIDNIDKFNFALGNHSYLKLLNTTHDKDKSIYFYDQYSYTDVAWNVDVHIVNFTTRALMDGATLRIIDDRGKTIMDRVVNGGALEGLELIQYRCDDGNGTVMYTPYYLSVSRSGYGKTVYSADITKNTLLELELRPPNHPPTINVTSIIPGSISAPLTVMGVARDDFEVTGVEFSIDDGAWNMANGTTNFQFELVPSGLLPGSHTLHLRASDIMEFSDVLNITFLVYGIAGRDSDSDGLLDVLEDINGNGVVDANETDPNDPDSDDDGLPDGIEVDNSDGNTTNPLNADTDGDGIKDGDEDHNHNGRVDRGESDPLDPLDPTKTDSSPGFDSRIMIAIIVVLILAIVVILVVRIRNQKNDELEADEFHEGNIVLSPPKSSHTPEGHDDGERPKRSRAPGRHDDGEHPKRSRAPGRHDDGERPKRSRAPGRHDDGEHPKRSRAPGRHDDGERDRDHR